MIEKKTFRSKILPIGWVIVVSIILKRISYKKHEKQNIYNKKEKFVHNKSFYHPYHEANEKNSKIHPHEIH